MPVSNSSKYNMLAKPRAKQSHAPERSSEAPYGPESLQEGSPTTKGLASNLRALRASERVLVLALGLRLDYRGNQPAALKRAVYNGHMRVRRKQDEPAASWSPKRAGSSDHSDHKVIIIPGNVKTSVCMFHKIKYLQWASEPGKPSQAGRYTYIP